MHDSFFREETAKVAVPYATQYSAIFMPEEGKDGFPVSHTLHEPAHVRMAA
jgi:hypothetical protein